MARRNQTDNRAHRPTSSTARRSSVEETVHGQPWLSELSCSLINCIRGLPVPRLLKVNHLSVCLAVSMTSLPSNLLWGWQPGKFEAIVFDIRPSIGNEEFV